MASPASELHEACDVVEALLMGSARRQIVDAVAGGGGGPKALGKLRATLRAQAFGRSDERVELEPLVRKLDHRTRREGFRVLHSWDHKSHRFTGDITPVLMLDRFQQSAEDEVDIRSVCSILLDYYFLHVLALCAMRAWDDDEPDAVLDRVTGLLGLLQGADGSGHRFLDDAETLIIYALSQFHPEEQAYDRLIEKVTTLRASRQIRFARTSASVLSSHLRWGFWLMYERDVLRMRNDNVGDYPWLLTSVLTLMREYAAQLAAGTDVDLRSRVVDGLLQGLAADPWAFTGKPPSSLADHVAEHEELSGLLRRHGEQLVLDLEAHRPSKEAYSPLALHYNFPHNTLVALVAMALEAGEPQARPLNALLVRDPEDRSAEPLARALMAYSSASPDRLGFQGAMLVAYDPLSGLRTFTLTVKAIREMLAEPG